MLPDLVALRFSKVDLRDAVKKPLQKLAAARVIEPFERIDEQVQKRVFCRRLRLVGFAGLGHQCSDRAFSLP